MKTINEIVLFDAEDKTITLPVPIDNETTWLSANQMAILFDRDEKTILWESTKIWEKAFRI